ncbi:MAG: hypothetical protein AMXMBFR7_37550 [Planctomycetota bacterium]
MNEYPKLAANGYSVKTSNPSSQGTTKAHARGGGRRYGGADGVDMSTTVITNRASVYRENNPSIEASER